jgi:plastocyanin
LIVHLYLTFGQFLALLAGATSAASAPVDFSRAEQVHISLSSFQIAPGTLYLKAGQPVILTITNDGAGGHDLTASAFFAAAAIRRGDAQFIDQGVIRVRGGEKVVIAFVPAAGRYPMKCSHALHKRLGMSGSIDVTW